MHTRCRELTPCAGYRRFPGAYLTRLLIVAMAAMVVMAGCASPAKFQPSAGGESFPPYEGEVRVLENLPPSDQYTRIGIVRVEGVLLTKESEMMSKLKDKAADKGANAIVMQSAMKVIKNSDGSTTRKLAAWAIRLNR